MHSACLLVSKWFIVSGKHDLRLLNTATSSPGSKQELEGGVFPTPCKAKTGEAIVFGHPVCQSETGLVKPFKIYIYVPQATLLAKYKHSMNLGWELKKEHNWKRSQR